VRLRRCRTSRKPQRHELDRGDWTQLKTPIVARWAEGASDTKAARTQRGAGGAPVRDLSKRFTGRALAPPVFAKVQSQQRERPNDHRIRLWHHDREAAGRRPGRQKYNGGSRQPESRTRARSLVDGQNYYQLYIGLWRDSKSRTNNYSRS
jgi:hypothetical protein